MRSPSGLAVEELHDHEAIAVGERAEVEHLDDVIVADAARGLRLALEALRRRRRSRRDAACSTLIATRRWMRTFSPS